MSIFGSTSTTTPTFGVPAQQQSGIFGSTPVAATTTPSSTGLAFCTPSSSTIGSTPSLFGTAAFGTNITAATAGNTPSLFGAFGTNTTAATTTTGSTPSLFGAFGTNTSAAATTGNTPSLFGAFGTNTTAATTTTGNAPSMFGAFGTNTSAAAATTGNTPSLFGAFGTNTTAAATTGNTPSLFGAFGTNTTAAATTGSTPSMFGTVVFGTNPATTTAAATTAASTSSLFGTGTFGTTTATSLSTATTTSATLSFGSSVAATSTITSTTISVSSSVPNLFGNAPASITSFGTSVASTSAVASSVSATTLPAINFGTSASFGTISASPATTKVGLGGVDYSGSLAQAVLPVAPSSPLENTLPQELQMAANEVAKFVKEQKSIRGDISLFSPRSLVDTTETITGLSNIWLTISGVTTRQCESVRKLKLETAKCLRDCELAQKIKDSPASLNERHVAVVNYFYDKVIALEESAEFLKREVWNAYSQVQDDAKCVLVTAEELKLIVHRLHDTFVAICCKLHKFHNEIQLLKVHHLTLRKNLLKEDGDIFAAKSDCKNANCFSTRNSTSILEGPNPFPSLVNATLKAMNIFTPPEVSKLLSNSGSLSGIGQFNSVNSQNNLTHSGSPSSLQKPPLGQKRGKRYF